MVFVGYPVILLFVCYGLLWVVLIVLEYAFLCCVTFAVCCVDYGCGAVYCVDVVCLMVLVV